MELTETLTYKYELAENHLNYKKTTNLFPKNLNDRYIDYNLTAKEFNNLISSCITLEKNIFFFKNFGSNNYEFDEPNVQFLLDYINNDKLKYLKEDAEIFKIIDIENIKNLKSWFNGYQKTLDKTIDKTKTYYFKNNDIYEKVISPDEKHISEYYEKIKNWNYTKLDYQMSIVETCIIYLKKAIKIYKDFLIHFNILMNDVLLVDFERLNGEKNKLFKKIFSNFLQSSLKLAYLEKKLKIINRYMES